jgi:uncharacterized protein (TIGR00369 family)
MPDYDEKLYQYKQRNSYNCFGCGLENPFGLKLQFFDNGRDGISCEAVIPNQFQGYPGIAHGGIVATILDEAISRTAFIKDPLNFMVTAKIEVKYLRPVPTETLLTALGKVTRNRGRLIQAEATLFLPDGTPAAEACGTLLELPEEQQFDAPALEAFGWEVIED